MRIYQSPHCAAEPLRWRWSRCGGPVAAQWLEVPVPGTPRTADGKPNLKARRRARPTANRICPACGGSKAISGSTTCRQGRPAADAAVGEALYKQRQSTMATSCR